MAIIGTSGGHVSILNGIDASISFADFSATLGDAVVTAVLVLSIDANGAPTRLLLGTRGTTAAAASYANHGAMIYSASRATVNDAWAVNVLFDELHDANDTDFDTSNEIGDLFLVNNGKWILYTHNKLTTARVSYFFLPDPGQPITPGGLRVGTTAYAGQLHHAIALSQSTVLAVSTARSVLRMTLGSDGFVWSTQEEPFTQANPPTRLQGISAVGATLYAVGEGGLLAYSNDSGQTWTKVTIANMGGHLFGVDTVDNGQKPIIYVGAIANLYKSCSGELTDLTVQKITLGVGVSAPYLYHAVTDFVFVPGLGSYAIIRQANLATNKFEPLEGGVMRRLSNGVFATSLL